MLDADATVAALNGLIRSAEDGHAALRRAAEVAADPDLKALFSDLSAGRGAMVRDLQTRVAELGGVPETEGTLRGGAVRMLAELKERIAGHDREGLISGMERSEAEVARRFEDTLARDLPPRASELVADHLDRLRADRARIAAARVSA
jgi:uncharacterized protein (TIGR02284 family)